MPYQDESLNQLIINKLSQEQYNELAEAGTISANQLYFVEAEGSLDAASSTIENVANPINNTDAANKQYVDTTISDNLTSLSSTVSSNYATKQYVENSLSGVDLTNYATVSSVTNISNSLSGYAANSNVNSISSTLNTNITYVSSQVSGIPSTITGLSSTVSSTYALKTELPTTEDLDLTNYATVSSVTNISNSLSGDVTYVSSQVSGLLPTINNLTSTVEGINSTAYNGGTAETGAYVVGTIDAIPVYTPDNKDPTSSNFFVRPADSINTAIYTTVLTNTNTNERKIYEISSSQFADVLSAGKIIASRDYVDGKLDAFDLSEYATTASVENINNNLSSFVPYSTSGTLEFTPIEEMPYRTLSANADGISSYFSIGGNTSFSYKYFSLVGYDSPKLRFWSHYEESDLGEVLVSNSAETIYENGSITYNNNQLVFPEEAGTLVVNSQLSAYSLSSDVSSAINKVSDIASQLSALSDISAISAEYTIDTVVQKLNEVIIRLNTLTTTLK